MIKINIGELWINTIGKLSYPMYVGTMNLSTRRTVDEAQFSWPPTLPVVTHGKCFFFFFFFFFEIFKKDVY